RLRVTDIPDTPGVEVFPTIEMIDRLYPPPGQMLKFPVPIDLTAEELQMAADGKFVTRVIYVEDPQLALPESQSTSGATRWMEVRAGADPLVTADNLGRPMAILRMGGLAPDANQPNDAFLFGSPPLMVYDAQLRAPPGGVMLTPHEMPLEPLH
ncbi:MAG TPA: hypothetical protein PKC18_13445, partial [Lacipirellulaceae bacterium]|nr:hypothetical protein [Lacipirellulaceae bacterium]